MISIIITVLFECTGGAFDLRSPEPEAGATISNNWKRALRSQMCALLPGGCVLHAFMLPVAVISRAVCKVERATCAPLTLAEGRSLVVGVKKALAAGAKRHRHRPSVSESRRPEPWSELRS